MSSENLAKPYQKCNCDCLCKPFNTARFGEEPTFKFSPEVSTKIQEASSPQVAELEARIAELEWRLSKLNKNKLNDYDFAVMRANEIAGKAMEKTNESGV